MARVIFYQRNGARELEEWMSAYLKPGDIVFERDSHFYPCMEKAEVFRKTYEDYLSEEDCYEIDATALRYSENWYRKGSGEDFSFYEGVYLGQMVEYKLMKYFVSLLKDIAFLLRLKEREMPEAFVFVDDNTTFSELLKGFSNHYGIGREIVPKSLSPHPDLLPLVGRGNRAGFREKIKFFVWHLLNFLNRFFHKKFKPEQTILIEAYGKFIPLIKRLAEEGNRVIVIGRLGFGKGLFHHGISYYSWSALRGQSVYRDDLNEGTAPVFRRFLTLRKSLDDMRFTFNSFDASSLVIKRLGEVINQDFLDITASISRIRRFLINQNVNTIITLQDRDGINRILVASGNSLGINTMEIQHGTLANLPSHVTPLSRKLCVWGKAGKEFYSKRNIEEKRVYIVGDPNLEGLKKTAFFRMDRLKKMLGLSPDKPVVLFASQPFIEITSLDSPLKTVDLFEYICEVAGKLKEIQFLVKFHPSENSEMKREILKRYRSRNLFIAQRGLTNELLSLSHVLICFCSSIVLEAGLLRVPVIMVNITGKRDFLPVVEMGGALSVYHKRDIITSINSVLYDEEMRKRLVRGQERFIASQIDLREDSFKRMLEII